MLWLRKCPIGLIFHIASGFYEEILRLKARLPSEGLSGQRETQAWGYLGRKVWEDARRRGKGRDGEGRREKPFLNHKDSKRKNLSPGLSEEFI
jgi:hypothetical protein